MPWLIYQSGFWRRKSCLTGLIGELLIDNGGMTCSTFIVIKCVSFSTQMGMKFQLLIKGKMVLMLKHEH